MQSIWVSLSSLALLALLRPLLLAAADTASVSPAVVVLQSPACQHHLRLRVWSASAPASALLQWNPLPPPIRRFCRELELQLFATIGGPPRGRLSLRSVRHLSCSASSHRLDGLRPTVTYRATVSVLQEPSGLYCLRPETLAFGAWNLTAATAASAAAMAVTTNLTADGNSTPSALEASGRYSPPRWTVSDALIFLLVLAAWAAAVAVFLHKLGSLRLSRSSRSDGARHLRPKNLDKVQVCAEPNRTVIYREYARGSRMSICMEERQARLACLQRRYAEERALEAIEEQAAAAATEASSEAAEESEGLPAGELCGLRPLHWLRWHQHGHQLHQHQQQTLDAISLRRLPTYAVTSTGGVNLQVLPPAGTGRSGQHLLHPASAVVGVNGKEAAAAAATSAPVSVISSGRLPSPKPSLSDSREDEMSPAEQRSTSKAPLIRQFSESAVSNGAGGDSAADRPARLASLGSSIKSEPDPTAVATAVTYL